MGFPGLPRRDRVRSCFSVPPSKFRAYASFTTRGICPNMGVWPCRPAVGCPYERRLNMVSREATTVWEGDLVHGSGNVSGMSGALDKLPVTFKSRIGSPDGRTSPEELIAAAHSSCFSMALANLLTEEGHPPSHLEVTADVTLDDSSGAPTITASALK